MSSLDGYVSTATQALSTGIIIAIVVGSVVGFAILVGIIICMYCLCCRKSKTYPGAVIQAQPYPGNVNQVSPYPYQGPPYNNQPMNQV